MEFASETSEHYLIIWLSHPPGDLTQSTPPQITNITHQHYIWEFISELHTNKLYLMSKYVMHFTDSKLCKAIVPMFTYTPTTRQHISGECTWWNDLDWDYQHSNLTYTMLVLKLVTQYSSITGCVVVNEVFHLQLFNMYHIF